MFGPSRFLVGLALGSALSIGLVGAVAAPAGAIFLPHMAFAVDFAGYSTPAVAMASSFSSEFEVPAVTCPDHEQRASFDGMAEGAGITRPDLAAGVQVTCSGGTATYSAVAVATTRACCNEVTDDAKYNFNAAVNSFPAGPGTYLAKFTWRPFTARFGALEGLIAASISQVGGTGTATVVGGKMRGQMTSVFDGIFSDNYCRADVCGVNGPPLFHHPALFSQISSGSSFPTGSTWTSGGRTLCDVTLFVTSPSNQFDASCPRPAAAT